MPIGKKLAALNVDRFQRKAPLPVHRSRKTRRVTSGEPDSADRGSSPAELGEDLGEAESRRPGPWPRLGRLVRRFQQGGLRHSKNRRSVPDAFSAPLPARAPPTPIGALGPSDLNRMLRDLREAAHHDPRRAASLIAAHPRLKAALRAAMPASESHNASSVVIG